MAFSESIGNDVQVFWDDSETALAHVRKVSPKNSAKVIDTTVLGDTEDYAEVGTADTSVILEMVGPVTDFAVGDKGNLSIQYPGDAEPTELGYFCVFDMTPNISNNTVISVSVEFGLTPGAPEE